MCWVSPLTAILLGRSTFTVLLRWHLENLVFCLAFGHTFFPPSCWRFTRASSGPIWSIVLKFWPVQPSSTSNFSTRFREERQDFLATPTSIPNLFLLMPVAGWPLYLCSTDTITVTNSFAELVPRPAEIFTSQSCYIAQTSREWNLLSCSVLPPEYDLQSFKSKVNKHIMTDLRNLDRTRLDK